MFIRRKDNKLNKSTKTSKGGYVLFGVIILLVAAILTIEQLRKFNEQKALKFGVDNICTIIELNRNKTQFAKYSYQIDGKTFYSQRATPFSSIYPGEMFKMKYLRNKPDINKILFEYPVFTKKEQSKVRGYIEKIIDKNEAAFHYKFKNVTYERWQLLREGHSLKQGDSIDILVIATNPKIGILYY